MRKVVRTTWAILIGVIVFITVSIIDLVALLVLGLNKLVRVVLGGLMTIFYDDDDAKDVQTIVNYGCNHCYTTFIDLMYPDEDEIEEIEEDEP